MILMARVPAVFLATGGTFGVAQAHGRYFQGRPHATAVLLGCPLCTGGSFKVSRTEDTFVLADECRLYLWRHLRVPKVLSGSPSRTGGTCGAASRTDGTSGVAFVHRRYLRGWLRVPTVLARSP